MMILQKNLIKLSLEARNKKQVIDELVKLLDDNGRLVDKDRYKKAILDREAHSSTGFEMGIAIPHAKTSAVKEPSLAIGVSKKGIDYDAMDEELSHIFFMIAMPEGSDNKHLELLAKLAGSLVDEENILKFKNAVDVDEIYELVSNILQDDAKNIDNNGEENLDRDLVLAVSACPTGIAHTYMAKESLERAARDRLVNIKVETHGASGVGDVLSNEEIKLAKVIIVAADKDVPMQRFHGKPVIRVPVAMAVKDAEGLLKKGLEGEVPNYIHEGGGGNSEDSESSFSVYKNLMSGVSNMLPFVIAGGIFIAISFMFGINAGNPSDPTYNPIAGFFSKAGGAAFSFLIPVLAGYIGYSIASKPAFMPAMVGGFLASQTGAGFLGGLVAGFVGGYSIVFLKRVLSGLPKSLDGIKAVLLYPLLGLLITSLVVLYISMPLSSFTIFLNNFLSNMQSSGLLVLGLILGGMMAVDLGGPINKVAFTFGIAAIDGGNFAPHAAVMAGGMVPPLITAVAASLFKNKFSLEQRRAGLTNYIMGASFITEGAIPFAATKPLIALPIFIVFSAISGALAMLFGATLPAPHGGLFVFPLVNNALMYYVVAIGLTSILGGIVFGLFWDINERLRQK